MSTIPDEQPFEEFSRWFAAAQAGEPLAEAATSATATRAGAPSARMVLLKGADPRGFVFYTNLDSRKGEELRENPRAALCFHWKSLRRQVRIEGLIEPVSAAEADAYFATAPARLARLGAWASLQSQTLGKPRGVRAAAQRGDGALCRRTGAAAAELVRLSHRAGDHRVLGGASVPAASPHRLSPRRRGMAQRVAVPLTMLRPALPSLARVA